MTVLLLSGKRRLSFANSNSNTSASGRDKGKEHVQRISNFANVANVANVEREKEKKKKKKVKKEKKEEKVPLDKAMILFAVVMISSLSSVGTVSDKGSTTTTTTTSSSSSGSNISRRFALVEVEAFGFFGGGGGGGGGNNQRRRQQQQQQRKETRDPELDYDLYEILEIKDEEEASMQDIKKSYRKLSLRYHPDRAEQTQENVDMFQKISRAYEILGDEELKFLYDFGGMEAVKKQEESKKGGGGGGAMDPFQAFFGGGGGGGGSGVDRGPSAQMELPVTLEDIYKGANKKTQYRRRIVCRGCSTEKKASSPEKEEKCRKCGRCPNEVRTVHRPMGPGFMVQTQEEVPSKSKCKVEPKELEMLIEKGVQDGHQLKFPYASEQRPGQIPGDVIVALKQRKHERFERRGKHLHTTMHISLKEALLGFEKKITHLDGHVVSVTSGGEIVRPFQTIVIQEEGMPVHETPAEFGDLHVTLEVDFPKSLSSEQQEALNKLF